MHTFLTQKFCFMCFMQFLDLQNNQIADAGLTAFAKAVESGALAPGAKVYLMRNSATETGKQAMRDAAKARGLSVYLSFCTWNMCMT